MKKKTGSAPATFWQKSIQPIAEAWKTIVHHKVVLAMVLIIFASVAIIELNFGRSPFGPDGKFGWWNGDINSNEDSQRFADIYSISHILHGIIFYGILWLAFRKMPMRYRFIIALLMEAAWELFENSPFIIHRYQAMTLSIHYVGDSILNSLSDIFMMIIGFFLASRLRIWMSVTLVIAVEIIMLILIRDNLTLNILMLLYPIEVIKHWQMTGGFIF